MRYLVLAFGAGVPIGTVAPTALEWLNAHHQGVLVTAGCVTIWVIYKIVMWDGR